MTDTRPPGDIFAEFLTQRLNRGQQPVEEPAKPPTPRAPRPDYSQGSSANPTYLDRYGMSAQLFERAIHAAINRPLWTELS